MRKWAALNQERLDDRDVIYDVYGYAGPGLGDQPGRLAEALGVEWTRHESDYRGTYFAARPATGAGKLRLQANDLRDGDDEYHQEPDFPECRYLLFADKFDHPDEVRAKLASLPQWRFLRRSVVE